jgi:uncharacterized membrane protein
MEKDVYSYIENIQEINKNLREHLEMVYKLLRTKLKIESNSRLENILNEMEILKTSLSFSMQKQSNIVSMIVFKYVYVYRKYKKL